MCFCFWCIFTCMCLFAAECSSCFTTLLLRSVYVYALLFWTSSCIFITAVSVFFRFWFYDSSLVHNCFCARICRVCVAVEWFLIVLLDHLERKWILILFPHVLTVMTVLLCNVQWQKVQRTYASGSVCNFLSKSY
jgi:hypothetical protein